MLTAYGGPGLSKNLVEFAPAGDAPRVVPPRGIAASAYAKKMPPALFLNAAASDKTHYGMQVWNLCANRAAFSNANPAPRFAFESLSKRLFDKLSLRMLTAYGGSGLPDNPAGA